VYFNYFYNTISATQGGCNMYLWNTNALANELKEGTLSEREKFKYYITSTLLYELLILVTSFSARTFSAVEIFLSLLSIAILFFGTYQSYRVNQKGDGLNFIERFICLSLPIGIKIIVWYFLGMIIFFIVMILLGGRSSELNDYGTFWGLFYLVTSFSAYILCYWRIYVHIKWISHK